MTAKKSPWPSVEAAVSAILLRDAFAASRLHLASRAVTLLLALLAFSLAGTFALWARPGEYRFVLTEADGRIMPIVALTAPNKDDDFVAKWTVDAVTRLYSFDFVNYRGQFQRARRDMTALGFESFEAAMDASGNFRAVTGNRFVTTAVPTGPAVIVKKGDYMGRFAWRVEFPMQIAYRAAPTRSGEAGRSTSQDLKVSVTVVRQPENMNRNGLGVRAIQAERP